MEEKSAQRTINDLYGSLFDTLEELRAKKISVYQANGIVNVAQTIINAGKLECQMIETIGTNGTGFMPDDQSPPKSDRLRLVHRANGS